MPVICGWNSGTCAYDTLLRPVMLCKPLQLGLPHCRTDSVTVAGHWEPLASELTTLELLILLSLICPSYWRLMMLLLAFPFGAKYCSSLLYLCLCALLCHHCPLLADWEGLGRCQGRQEVPAASLSEPGCIWVCWFSRGWKACLPWCCHYWRRLRTVAGWEEDQGLAHWLPCSLRCPSLNWAVTSVTCVMLKIHRRLQSCPQWLCLQPLQEVCPGIITITNLFCFYRHCLNLLPLLHAIPGWHWTNCVLWPPFVCYSPCQSYLLVLCSVNILEQIALLSLRNEPSFHSVWPSCLASASHASPLLMLRLPWTLMCACRHVFGPYGTCLRYACPIFLPVQGPPAPCFCLGPSWNVSDAPTQLYKLAGVIRLCSPMNSLSQITSPLVSSLYQGLTLTHHNTL